MMSFLKRWGTSCGFFSCTGGLESGCCVSSMVLAIHIYESHLLPPLSHSLSLILSFSLSSQCSSAEQEAPDDETYWKPQYLPCSQGPDCRAWVHCPRPVSVCMCVCICEYVYVLPSFKTMSPTPSYPTSSPSSPSSPHAVIFLSLVNLFASFAFCFKFSWNTLSTFSFSSQLPHRILQADLARQAAQTD